jgi:hypothetical protein
MSTDHWSSSQFHAWDLCPTTYRERYVDGVKEDTTWAMAFGSVIHLALEEHYRGGDGDQAFKKAWRATWPDLVARILETGNTPPGGGLHFVYAGVGLNLLDRVYNLGLEGEPEVPFTMDTTQDWLKPTTGFIDLVDWGGKHIYDFKTTIGTWGEGRANQDIWQPTLYQRQVQLMVGEVYDFSYVTLNKRTMEVSFIQPTVPYEERLGAMLVGGTMIAAMDANGSYPCKGGHGTCPECAGTWDHGHVCDWTLAPPRIHIKPRLPRLAEEYGA